MGNSFGINLSCVIAGISTALMLKNAGVGAFWAGLGSTSNGFFFSPSSSLYNIFAGSVGQLLTVVFTVIVSCLAALIPLYTKERKDAFRTFLVAFMCTGFFGLWIIADIFFNYDIFIYEGIWDIPILICTALLYLFMFLSIAFSIYIKIRNVEQLRIDTDL